ncbi:hypothetical protein BT93_G2363 [Corymbia citriodora subsp. variegata]|nr:hypothetical protein BT93_G2363 [Corymbia citriodora subsp. variegata]
MDVLGVNNHHRKKTAAGRRSDGAARRRSSAEKGIKVVYISSPMKVKTSAADFRATVQGLTGRDSDVARFMDPDGGGGGEKPQGRGVDERGFVAAGDYYMSGNGGISNNNCGFGINSHNNASCDSPTESDSVFEPFEGGSVHGGEREMLFPCSYFTDPAMADKLMINLFDAID